MLIFWRIRYLDHADQQFKDRDLDLDTATLGPVERAAVEMLVQARNHGNERGMLRVRSLFQERTPGESLDQPLGGYDKYVGFGISDYFEDEAGGELSEQEMGAILTGNPDVIHIPHWARQHDIDYWLAPKTPVPVAEVTLSPEEVRLLAYFGRDCRELRGMALMRAGPGSLTSGKSAAIYRGGDYEYRSSVTDDEVRSYLTTYRRLYMDREFANFTKAAALFERVLNGHPLGAWVAGAVREYQAHLCSTPGANFPPIMKGCQPTFNVKRLIDVFLYTRYHHQPDGQKERQYADCLRELGGRANLLFWLFLREVHESGRQVVNAGARVEQWLAHYCHARGLTPEVIESPRIAFAGLGTVEKPDAARDRQWREAVDQVQNQLWTDAGHPSTGPAAFRQAAEEQLRGVLGGGPSP